MYYYKHFSFGEDNRGGVFFKISDLYSHDKCTVYAV